MMENLSYGQVIGDPSAPFLNRLAKRGALFTNSRAITHPSEPNYLTIEHLYHLPPLGQAGRTHPITNVWK
jgi:hypothetical protein